MKKLIGLALAVSIITLSAQSRADVFNGTYMGAALGWQFAKHKVNNKSENFNHFPVSIHGGYMCSQPENFLWGLEASFGYGFGKKDFIIAKVGDSETYQGISGTVTNGKLVYEHRRKFFGELLGKLGWNWGQVATYFIGGIVAQQIENKIVGKSLTINGLAVDLDGNSLSGTLFKKTEVLWGGVLGAGSAFKFTDNLSARVEYKFHITKKPKFTTQRLNTHDIRVGLDWAF